MHSEAINQDEIMALTLSLQSIKDSIQEILSEISKNSKIKPLEIRNFVKCLLCMLKDTAGEDYLSHTKELKQFYTDRPKDSISDKNDSKIESQVIGKIDNSKRKPIESIPQKQPCKKILNSENKFSLGVLPNKSFSGDKHYYPILNSSVQMPPAILQEPIFHPINPAGNQINLKNPPCQSNPFSNNLPANPSAKTQRIKRTKYTLDELKCLGETFYKAKNNKTRYECSICLNDYAKNDKISFINCIHFFHTSCLKKWLIKKNECPTCNAEVIIE